MKADKCYIKGKYDYFAKFEIDSYELSIYKIIFNFNFNFYQDNKKAKNMK